MSLGTLDATYRASASATGFQMRRSYDGLRKGHLTDGVSLEASK